MRFLCSLAVLAFASSIPARAAEIAPPAATAAPWTSTLPVLSVAALQRDVDTLESTYAALHPGLQRYLDDTQLDAAYAELRRRFAQPVRLDQARPRSHR